MLSGQAIRIPGEAIDAMSKHFTTSLAGTRTKVSGKETRRFIIPDTSPHFNLHLHLLLFLIIFLPLLIFFIH